MKKLVIYLLLGLVVGLNSFGVNAQNISTSISNASGCQGDTVSISIPVNMTNGASVSAISMAINYDSTKLMCLGGAQNLNNAITSGYLTNCVTVP